MTSNAPRLFREPFHKGGAVADFATCFVQRLALLQREKLRKIFQIFEHESVPAFQQARALGMCFPLPRPEGSFGGLDRRARFSARHIWDRTNDLTSGRIRDRDRVSCD
ncbi:hypothetical protein ACVWZK_000239 [Bradyrhizobium sp. GM0.4]